MKKLLIIAIATMLNAEVFDTVKNIAIDLTIKSNIHAVVLKNVITSKNLKKASNLMDHGNFKNTYRPKISNIDNYSKMPNSMKKHVRELRGF